MSCEPLANAIFNKIEPKFFHVSSENAQEIFTKLDNIQNVETRVANLEQVMQRGHQGVVAQVTAEMHHMHAQLEAKLNRQTWLLRVSFALVFALVVGIIVGMQMSIWMQGENKATCLRPLVAYGRLHCQVIDDGPSDVEHIADGMKALWNYTQHFNYSEWVTKFNTPP
jgi:hypothetical protein